MRLRRSPLVAVSSAIVVLPLQRRVVRRELTTSQPRGVGPGSPRAVPCLGPPSFPAPFLWDVSLQMRVPAPAEPLSQLAVPRAGGWDRGQHSSVQLD